MHAGLHEEAHGGETEEGRQQRRARAWLGLYRVRVWVRVRVRVRVRVMVMVRVRVRSGVRVGGRVSSAAHAPSHALGRPVSISVAMSDGEIPWPGSVSQCAAQ